MKRCLWRLEGSKSAFQVLPNPQVRLACKVCDDVLFFTNNITIGETMAYFLTLMTLFGFILLTSCKERSGSALASSDIDGINFSTVVKVSDLCLGQILTYEDRSEEVDYTRLGQAHKKQVDAAAARAIFIAKQQFKRSAAAPTAIHVRVSDPTGSTKRFVKTVDVEIEGSSPTDSLSFSFYNANEYADPETVRMRLLTIRRSHVNDLNATSYMVCEIN